MDKFRCLGMMLLLVAIASCGNKTGADTTGQPSEAQSMVKDPASYDPSRGEGKWTAELLKLDPAIDAKMAEVGMKIQSVKCSSCHKLTEEKLVGPGWKGVTERRKAEWIMNFITNPDPMIDKDPEVQAQLEICLVRMPNQNLTDEEARQVLEFMRQNDGAK
jgi:cytochrome c551/c552